MSIHADRLERSFLDFLSQATTRLKFVLSLTRALLSNSEELCTNSVTGGAAIKKTTNRERLPVNRHPNYDAGSSARYSTNVQGSI